MSVEEVVRRLLSAYADEWVAAYYYTLTAYAVKGPLSEVVAEHFLEEAREELERHAGKYALITNWREGELSGCDVLKEYKSRNGGIEWVFKGLKRDINVRPIYLRDSNVEISYSLFSR